MSTKLKFQIPGDEYVVPGYQWVVICPELLGGQPVIKGTRISVAHILECLAGGMTFEEIAEDFGVPPESFADAMRYAAAHITGEVKRVAS